MPICSQDAATGYGFSPHQATLIGANPLKQNGTGITQSGATILKSRGVEVNGVSTATAFVPPVTSGVMEPYYLINTGSASALVYVPLGHTLSTPTNGGVNGFFTLAVSTSAIFYQYKPKFWAVNLSAAVS